MFNFSSRFVTPLKHFTSFYKHYKSDEEVLFSTDHSECVSGRVSVMTEYEENEYPLVEENVQIPDHQADKIEQAFKASKIENAFKSTEQNEKQNGTRFVPFCSVLFLFNRHFKDAKIEMSLQNPQNRFDYFFVFICSLDRILTI